MSDAPLDVLARLEEHQSNLRSAPAPHTCALLALPLPAIARALAHEELAERREEALKESARLLGGGDGPLPIVDLERDTRPLPALLRDLAERYAALQVWGGRDQPGFARELWSRWHGGLHGGLRFLDEGVTVWLMDDPRPVLDLGHGVVRIYAGSATPRAGGRVLVGVPPWTDPASVEGEAYVVDRKRRLGSFSGFLPREAVLGDEQGAALRGRWLARWAGAREAVRCGVLELDPLLESRLRLPPVPGPPDARVIAVTGIDGSGKSTHVAELVRRLSEAGYRVASLKMYRHGAFLDLADEMSGRTRTGAPLAALRLSRLVKLVDSLRVYFDCFAPAMEQVDVVVMDRYVETHIAAAGSQLGWDVTGHPLLPFPRPALQFWLRLDPAEALARLGERAERLTADEHPAGLAGYVKMFSELAVSERDIVLDARAPQDVNASLVAERALRAAPRPVPGTGGVIVVPGAEAPAGVRRGKRRAITIGGGSGTLMGEEVYRLQDRLGERGRLLSMVEWLEIYGLQLLLDLEAAPDGDVVAPLWPGAVVALPGFEDCRGLEEIDRMLKGRVEVRDVVCSLSDEMAEALRRLAPGFPLPNYAQSLRRIALASRWPMS